MPFIASSPSAAGPGRVRCREAGEKLRVLCVGWPGPLWGRRRRHQAAFGRSSPGRRSGRLRQGPPTSAPSPWVPHPLHSDSSDILYFRRSHSRSTLFSRARGGEASAPQHGAKYKCWRRWGEGEHRTAEGRGPLQLPSGGNNGVWARNPTFMTEMTGDTALSL